MSQRERASQYDREALRTPRLLRCSADDGDTRQSVLADGTPFDADAWTLLVDEQRRLIAQAAGVDPSKVRIKVGH